MGLKRWYGVRQADGRVPIAGGSPAIPCGVVGGSAWSAAEVLAGSRRKSQTRFLTPVLSGSAR